VFDQAHGESCIREVEGITMLTTSQIEFYQENGFLHIPQVFDPAEISELSDEMDRLVEEWAFTSPGWSGPWRQAYMDPETEKPCTISIFIRQPGCGR
jgi:hypothetical protein